MAVCEMLNAQPLHSGTMTVNQAFRNQHFILAQLIKRITVIGIGGDAVEHVGAFGAVDGLENGLAHVVADLGTKLRVSAIHGVYLMQLDDGWVGVEGAGVSVRSNVSSYRRPCRISLRAG